MKPLRALVDLRECQEGFSGIAVDTCRIFKTLNQIESIGEVGGLLISQQSTGFKQSLPKTLSESDSYFKQAQYLRKIIPPPKKTRVDKVASYLIQYQAFLSFSWFFKQRFLLSPIDKKYYSSFIWDLFFSRTMPVEDYEDFLKGDFWSSNICYPLARFRTQKILPKVKLNTEGWDFLFTSNPINVKVSSKTKKIVRYHDAISLFYPHLTPNSPQENYRQLKSCTSEKSTYFVCNSAHTLNELLTLFPDVEKRATVISCSVSDEFYRTSEPPNFSEIITANLSFDCLRIETKGGLLGGSRDDQLKQTLNSFSGNYLISVSTIDPRKNYETLIRAWSEVRERVAPDLNLIIVGRTGWKSDQILSLMRPYFKEGALVHLSGVSFKSLRILLSYAKAYVFPTLAEGFGIPPIEAMRCGCPTIVSSIDVMRETCGEASIFANPNSVKEFSDQISSLIIDTESTRNLCADLVDKGYRQSAKYTIGQCKEKWNEYFSEFNKI